MPELVAIVPARQGVFHNVGGIRSPQSATLLPVPWGFIVLFRHAKIVDLQAVVLSYAQMNPQQWKRWRTMEQRVRIYELFC